MDRKGRNGGTLRSYEKGRSGNPAGRPKKKPDLLTRLMGEIGQDWDDLSVTLIGYYEGERPIVNQRTYSVDGEEALHLVLVYRLLVMAMNGDYEAIRIILDRTEGRVPPPMNLGNSTDGLADGGRLFSTPRLSNPRLSSHRCRSKRIEQTSMSLGARTGRVGQWIMPVLAAFRIS